MDEQQNEQAIQDQKIRDNMSRIGRKILIMSGKGGVGKTTVTVNLANALVSLGCKVGVLDTDIHGPNVAKMFGCEDETLLSTPDGSMIEPVRPREGLAVVSLSFAIKNNYDAIIFRGPMKTNVIRQFLADVNWGDLDFLLIDSPPGTGDEQITVCQSIPELTGSVIVSTPQDVAILDARRSVGFSRSLGVAIIGLVENMSGLICPHCGEVIEVFGKGGGKKMCEQMDVPFLGEIPMEVDLRLDEDLGKNWMENKDRISAQNFLEIAKKLNSVLKVSVSPKAKCDSSNCAGCSLNCSSRK